MSTHNRFSGVGGVDGSLQFELNNGENTGPGHATTLKFYANYLSSRSTLADLIAAGVYASVRSCGGPVVPLRLGRVDATEYGPAGVPQPQNSAQTFRTQFDRMGFTQSEMIQLVACGHTLGSVHSTEFPQIVPASTGQLPFDTSRATFDNKVATEYVAGTTTNPLGTFSGPAAAVGRNSDFKVFNSDGNATIRAMVDPTAFRNTCQTVLQKMIDVVPTGVTLTAPITPYAVKPVNMQLTLNSGGTTFLLSGFIRVRTTSLPASSINNIVLTWKDRNGGNSCGSSATCSTTATLQGVGTGFDDTFGVSIRFSNLRDWLVLTALVLPHLSEHPSRCWYLILHPRHEHGGRVKPDVRQQRQPLPHVRRCRFAKDSELPAPEYRCSYCCCPCKFYRLTLARVRDIDGGTGPQRPRRPSGEPGGLVSDSSQH